MSFLQTSYNVFTVDIDMKKLMEIAKKEMTMELKKETINGATSKRSAYKKSTKL